MRKNIKIYFIAALAFLTTAFSYGAPKLPTADLEGKSYYVYEIKKGDSLFGISRTFGWDYNKLRQLNPDAVSPLSKGMKIYYPAGDAAGSTSSAATVAPLDSSAIESDARGDYYTIKRGDTLFGVARSRNTTVEAILKLNPGISESNFRAGEQIMLPREGEGITETTVVVDTPVITGFKLYKADKHDTWSSIAEKTGLSIDELKTANPGLVKIKNKSLVSIPDVDTIQVEQVTTATDQRELTPEGRDEIYSEIHNTGNYGIDSDRVLKIAVVLDDPRQRKDLEFLRGMITALDRLRKLDYRVNFKVIDNTAGGTNTIEQLSEFDPNMVFTCSEKVDGSSLAEYAMVSQTPLINAFDVKSEAYKSNPYILQLLTPSADFAETVAEGIQKKYGDFILVFNTDIDKDDAIANHLLNIWDPDKIVRITKAQLPEYEFNAASKYLIYSESEKKNDIQQFLTTVKEIKGENPFTDIFVIGRPSWIVHNESMNQLFHTANVLMPTRFYYDPDTPQARVFESDFKALFGNAPILSYPLYAGLGYDAMVYFLTGLSRNGGDINQLDKSETGVQCEFDIKRLKNWSGMINPCVYLIRYGTGTLIDKISLN